VKNPRATRLLRDLTVKNRRVTVKNRRPTALMHAATA